MVEVINFESRILNYELLLTGKYTVLHGLSGTGKSLLCEFIARLSRSGKYKSNFKGNLYSSFTEKSDMWAGIKHDRGALIIIDEDSLASNITPISEQHSLYRDILVSPNYFILITREGMPSIPYGLNNICEMVGNDKHRRMIKVKFDDVYVTSFDRRIILFTEGTGNDFNCIEQVFSQYGYRVIPAGGKNNMMDILDATKDGKDTIIVCDTCGLNTDALHLVDLAREYKYKVVQAPSFEYCALSATSIDCAAVKDNITLELLLQYKSEEYFYAALLDKVLKDRYGIGYSKNSDKVSDVLLSGGDEWLYPEIPRVNSQAKDVGRLEL